MSDEPKPVKSSIALAAMALMALAPTLGAGPMAFEVHPRPRRNPLGLSPDDMDVRDILAVLRNAPKYTPEPKQRKKFRHNRRG